MLVVGLSAQAQVNGARQWVKLPCAAQLVGVTVRVEALTGAPTNCSLSVFEVVLDHLMTVTVFPAGTAAVWKSTHLGGPGNEPVVLPRGSELNATINLTGGTTPAADYDVQFWLLEG